MSNPSKRKGTRIENEFARLIGGKRVPLSGSHPDLPGDVVDKEGRIWQCKIRADGFKELYKWIDQHFGLYVRADRKPGLVVLRAEDYAALVSSRTGATGGSGSAGDGSKSGRG